MSETLITANKVAEEEQESCFGVTLKQHQLSVEQHIKKLKMEFM